MLIDDDDDDTALRLFLCQWLSEGCGVEVALADREEKARCVPRLWAHGSGWRGWLVVRWQQADGGAPGNGLAGPDRAPAGSLDPPDAALDSAAQPRERGCERRAQ